MRAAGDARATPTSSARTRACRLAVTTWCSPIPGSTRRSSRIACPPGGGWPAPWRRRRRAHGSKSPFGRFHAGDQDRGRRRAGSVVARRRAGADRRRRTTGASGRSSARSTRRWSSRWSIAPCARRAREQRARAAPLLSAGSARRVRDGRAGARSRRRTSAGRLAGPGRRAARTRRRIVRARLAQRPSDPIARFGRATHRLRAGRRGTAARRLRGRAARCWRPPRAQARWAPALAPVAAARLRRRSTTRRPRDARRGCCAPCGRTELARAPAWRSRGRPGSSWSRLAQHAARQAARRRSLSGADGRRRRLRPAGVRGRPARPLPSLDLDAPPPRRCLRATGTWRPVATSGCRLTPGRAAGRARRGPPVARDRRGRARASYDLVLDYPGEARVASTAGRSSPRLGAGYGPAHGVRG